MSDLLSHLPVLPLSQEMAIVIASLLASLAVSFIAILRNRPSISSPVEDAGDLGVVFENPASIVPHLVELRTRLVNSLIGVAVATVVSALITEQVIQLLAVPIGGLQNIQVIRVTESFHVFFQVSLTVGIILASPFVIAQIWIFVAAGLKASERRWFYLLFPFALILFLSGVSFAYLIMLPAAVPFLTGFMGVHTIPTLDDYVGFVSTVLLWVGVSFEMPLVIFLLAKMRIVNARLLVKYWRYAVVIIMIAAAIITPTPDPVNMLLVAAPLLVLYLLSIILALFA